MLHSSARLSAAAVIIKRMLLVNAELSERGWSKLIEVLLKPVDTVFAANFGYGKVSAGQDQRRRMPRLQAGVAAYVVGVKVAMATSITVNASSRDTAVIIVPNGTVFGTSSV